MKLSDCSEFIVICQDKKYKFSAKNIINIEIMGDVEVNYNGMYVYILRSDFVAFGVLGKFQSDCFDSFCGFAKMICDNLSFFKNKNKNNMEIG